MRSRPTTGDLGCGALHPGMERSFPTNEFASCHSRGEPQRKKRPWQRKRNFSPILTTLEFLSCHLAYQELQNIVKTPSNLRTHHLSFCAFFSQGLMRVYWDFILILALASNHLSVLMYAPQVLNHEGRYSGFATKSKGDSTAGSWPYYEE